MATRFLTLLAVAGCASSEATPAKDVAVELAGVTLADDCGANPAMTPPAVKRADADGKRAPRGDDMDADAFRQACEQTSMQLSFKAPAGGAKTAIRVKRVELLDAKGKVLETLTARAPSKWDGKKYVAWDESIGATETLATSYALKSPNWAVLTNGRWNAHTKKFQLRVTVTVGTQSRTVEKQAVAVAMVPPDVDT